MWSGAATGIGTEDLLFTKHQDARDAEADKALANLEGWTGWTGEVELDPVTGDRVPATVVIVNVDDDGELHVNPDWARAVGAPYGSTE